MIKQTFNDIYDSELARGAILNEGHPGFKEDYLVLHCLLRKYNPKTIFEVGTNMGGGTNIICNALPQSKVYSLDLPDELAHISVDHPVNGNNGYGVVGRHCKFPYKQLFGDSMTFDYTSCYPIQGWWIDGAHDFEHVYHETKEALDSDAKIIIFHDANIEGVWEGIYKAAEEHRNCLKYELYRVTDTRIAYLLRK